MSMCENINGIILSEQGYTPYINRIHVIIWDSFSLRLLLTYRTTLYQGLPVTFGLYPRCINFIFLPAPHSRLSRQISPAAACPPEQQLPAHSWALGTQTSGADSSSPPHLSAFPSIPSPFLCDFSWIQRTSTGTPATTFSWESGIPNHTWLGPRIGNSKKDKNSHRTTKTKQIAMPRKIPGVLTSKA